MSHIKVENDKSLVRDSSTGAILNTDREALVAYRRRKNLIKSQEDRINKLETDLSDIKNLLNTIIENINKE